MAIPASGPGGPPPSRGWRKVAEIDEMPVDSMKRVVIDGDEICLVHAEDGQFYAIGDVCTHEDFSLSDGSLWGLQVECPQHGSRFSLQTGVVTGMPAVLPARTYAVVVEGTDVLVEL
jgi:3-phenylpropionate/trans-cinnamate dioxygenase ferredoxin subunit